MMIRVVCFFTIMGVLWSIAIIPGCSAGSCAFGSAYAWFKASGDTWLHATVHPMLRRGEPFEIQVVVTSRSDLGMVFVKLHEFGTPVYEVLEGPTAMEQILNCQELTVANQSVSYSWTMKVRDDTSWVNGYAPLEVYVQFTNNDTSVSWVDFDVIVAFIIDEPWVNTSDEHIQDDYSSTETSRSLPSVGNAETLLISVMFIIVLRSQRQKH
jgi:sarcinarray family protein